MQTPEQFLRSFSAASAAVRKKYNTPAKARQFLVKAGILDRPVDMKSLVDRSFVPADIKPASIDVQ